LADALTRYADWLFCTNQVDEAIEYAEESDMLYKQIGSESSSINSLLFAEIAWSNGDTQKARSLFMELYQRFSVLGEKGFRSNSIGRLGLLAMEEGDLDRARAYLEEALLIEREAGWKPWEAFYLIELGHLFYLQGNLERFRQNVRESFSLKHYFPDYHKTFILMTLIGSLYFQKPESSARLLGVINNPNRETDVPRTPVEKRYCLHAEAHAREVLGNSAFEAAFAEGQKITIDEALDLALKTAEEI
jgi:tetratricopeptide (TPR) repeat protein